MTYGDPCHIIRVLIIEISKRKFRESYQHDFYSFWGVDFIYVNVLNQQEKNVRPKIIQIF